ncbi:LysR family transcriptional regulator [Chromobacterium phragmitis]|uniref:LysR family transcriptional regulator n=1 Tax=Chromobacterium phragmitis TaxID=2202141 RepID=UPI000DEC6FEF|nr:LysR family transcriptional regulator [Chromobacterium phragmitis]AXE29276.1 LysR family transcriptional regulator [Chromobacterium phragmitis]
MDLLAAMRAFRQVVACGSFSAAADAMDLSHTAVSRQISALERHLGAQLLNRTTRRLALTEAGHHYHRHCLDILDRVDEAERAAASLQARPAGMLRVNAPMAFANLEMGRWLPDFLSRFPDIKVDLVGNDRFVDLIAEEFDVGLRISRGLPDSSLVAKRLSASDMAVVASPDYLRRRGAPAAPEELAVHNVLTYSLALQTSELVFAAPDGQWRRVAVSGNLQANTGMVVCDAARAGLGIAVSATFVVHQDLREGRLVRLLPEYRLPARELYAVYPQNRHLSPKVRAFVDFAADYYAMPRWD